MVKRTKVIKVGSVKIGGGNPVSIQSMTNTVTKDVKNTVKQIKSLECAGCEIVRVAVKDMEDAKAIRRIKNKIKIPLVSDIHFDHRLALEAINSGSDKIRINPGNITKREYLTAILKAAKKRKIPIRIGVNSGSMPKRGGTLDDVKDAIPVVKSYIKLFEDNGFTDIVISLKSSNVVQTVNAYREVSKITDYPLHLGVTAAGPVETGIIKSSIGIGALLLEGIGDTIRVSLTGDPADEIRTAKKILQAVGLRKFGPDIISCPTCGRCQVDLVKIVNEVENKLNGVGANGRSPLHVNRKYSVSTIALMGCEVNGPGEAKEADIGIAFGKGTGMLFKNGKVIGKVSNKDVVKTILKYIK